MKLTASLPLLPTSWSLPPSFLAQTIGKVTGYFLMALLPLFHSFSTWLRMFLKYQSQHAIHSPAQNPSIAVNYTWDKNLNSFPRPSSASQGWLLCCQRADSLTRHHSVPTFFTWAPLVFPSSFSHRPFTPVITAVWGLGRLFPKLLTGLILTGPLLPTSR